MQKAILCYLFCFLLSAWAGAKPNLILMLHGTGDETVRIQ